MDPALHLYDKPMTGRGLAMYVIADFLTQDIIFGHLGVLISKVSDVTEVGVILKKLVKEIH